MTLETTRRTRKPRPDLAARNRAAHEHPLHPYGESANIKHCTGCCEEKPLEKFARDSAAPDGRRANCAVCAARASQAGYHRNGGREKAAVRRKALLSKRYAEVEKLKDVPCMDCGGRFPRICMDFDHVHGEKIDSISRMLRKAFSWELILAEMAKCEIVCSNCHRVRTAIRGQYIGYERAV